MFFHIKRSRKFSCISWHMSILEWSRKLIQHYYSKCWVNDWITKTGVFKCSLVFCIHLTLFFSQILLSPYWDNKPSIVNYLEMTFNIPEWYDSLHKWLQQLSVMMRCYYHEQYSIPSPPKRDVSEYLESYIKFNPSLLKWSQCFTD